MRGRAAGVALAAVVLVGCSSDGDDGGDDEPAAPTTEPEAPAEDVRVVNLNILHGIVCPPDTAACRRTERVQLFLDQLEEARCPPVVALQEVNPEMLTELQRQVPGRCEGAYELVWHDMPGVDRELVLSSLPVEGRELIRLAGPLRSAYWVRIRADVGPVDLVVTHLASSDNVPCDATACPPPCRPDGDQRTCQAHQVLALLERRRAPDGLGLVVGDLNAPVGDPVTDVFADQGFVDTHLEAGNPECDPDSGRSCTSGRDDASLADLTDPTSRQSERIDFMWADPPEGCDPVLDGPDDDDGDGLGTGLFNEEGEEDGPAGLAFTSDHTATALDLACR